MFYLLRFWFLAASAFFACSTFLYAGMSEQIVRDFKPLSGYVVGQENESYIVDLDSADGLSVGDVITVVEPGVALTHPVTGEWLGKLERIKAVLKVTQVQSGFSLARPIGPSDGVTRGDPIHRYQNVRAAFRDYTGEGERLYLELRSGLPKLQWEDYVRATERPTPAASAEGRPHLVFELREEGLAVRDAELRMLKAYASPSAVPDEEQQAGASPATVAAPPSPASPPVPARRPTREPIQLQFPQRERIARLPEEVKTADFIHYRGHMLVATSDGTSILVFHADERMSPVASVKPTTPGEILSVRWWIPEDKGSPLLIANVWKGDRPEGAIFALRENRLESVRETVFYILAPFDRDGDGRRELLLGQSFDRERFFGPRVRQLTLRGHELKTSEPSFRLPRDFTIQAATFADLTGDGLPELAFIRSNILYLYGPDGELLWRSGATVGGSPSALTYEIDPSLEFSPVNTVPFELTPVAADLNGDGVGELIVVAGELRSVSAPGLDPGAKKSWLAVLAFRDQAFVMGKLGPEFDVPMQGLAFDESRLLLITPESHAVSFFGKSSPSHLLALSLH